QTRFSRDWSSDVCSSDLPVGDWDAMVRRISAKTGFWIQDGLRHTAATYYFKLRGLDPVVKLLTHEGQHLAFRHYVGECNRVDAEIGRASCRGRVEHVDVE